MSTTRSLLARSGRRRMFGAAAASLAVLGAVSVALPQADAASLGRVFLSPATGDQDVQPTFDTNAVCASPATALIGKVLGPGITDNGDNAILGNTRLSLLSRNASGGYTAAASTTFKQVFQTAGVLPQAAEYQVVLVCTDNSGVEDYGTLAGSVTLSAVSGFTFTYTQASSAAATTTALSTSPSSPVASGTQTTLTATVAPTTAAGRIQFKRDGINLGASQVVANGSATLTIGLAPGRSVLTAVFTPDDTNSFQASTSAESPYLVAPAPVVTGTAQVGGTLTCEVNSPGSHAYRWLLGGADSGVSGASVRVPASWAGKQAACRATTTDDGGSLVQTSDARAIATGAALVAKVKPTVSGTAKVGKALTCKPGTWSPAASSYRYQWLRTTKPIAKATAATYKLTTADRRAKVSCRVTASAAGYAPGTTTSAAVAVK